MIGTDASEESHNLHAMRNFPMIFFKELDPSVAGLFDNSKLASLDRINNQPALEAANSISKKIDDATAKDASLPDQFVQLLCGLIDSQSLSKVSSLWPPEILNSSPNVMLGLTLVVSMLQNSFNPTKLLDILASSLTKSLSSMVPPSIIGICRCSVPNEKSSFWAVIDRGYKFTLNSDVNFAPQIVGQAASVQIIQEKQSVAVKDADDKVISEFKPEDPRQIALWDKIFSDSPAPFPAFITSIPPKCPDVMFSTFYECMIAQDFMATRAILHPNFTAPPERASTISHLFSIFSYAGKVQELITCLIASDFEFSQLEEHCQFGKNSNISPLIKLFISKFGPAYHTSFLTKLAQFVKAQALNPEDPASYEQSIFSIVKHIISSLAFVPIEIRHLCSVIKAFLIQRYNNKAEIYEFILSNVFEPLCELPNLEISPSVKLIKRIFAQQLMAGEYSAYEQWNRRLELHTFPKIEEFIFSLTDIKEAPPYNSDHSEFKISIGTMIYRVSNSNEAFFESYNEILSKPSVQKWSLSFEISSFFKTSNEVESPKLSFEEIQRSKSESAQCVSGPPSPLSLSASSRPILPVPELPPPPPMMTEADLNSLPPPPIEGSKTPLPEIPNLESNSKLENLLKESEEKPKAEAVKGKTEEAKEQPQEHQEHIEEQKDQANNLSEKAQTSEEKIDQIGKKAETVPPKEEVAVSAEKIEKPEKSPKKKIVKKIVKKKAKGEEKAKEDKESESEQKSKGDEKAKDDNANEAEKPSEEKPVKLRKIVRKITRVMADGTKKIVTKVVYIDPITHEEKEAPQKADEKKDDETAESEKKEESTEGPKKTKKVKKVVKKKAAAEPVAQPEAPIEEQNEESPKLAKPKKKVIKKNKKKTEAESPKPMDNNSDEGKPKAVEDERNIDEEKSKAAEEEPKAEEPVYEPPKDGEAKPKKKKIVKKVIKKVVKKKKKEAE